MLALPPSPSRSIRPWGRRTVRLCLLLLPLLLASAPARGFWGAGALDGMWRVSGGEVRYRVRHLMHDAVGVSSAVSGSARCEASICTVALRVPVASFISKDPARDRDMQAATHASAYPIASVRGAVRMTSGAAGAAAVKVTLAGTERRVADIPVQIDRSGDDARLTAQFRIALRDFGIEPPALLGIAIQNEVRIDLALRLHRE